MKRFILIVLMTVMFPALALGFDIYATVDRDTISVNESVQFTVTIIDGDAPIDISPLKDFRVQSQGSSSNIQIVNGQVSKQKSYIYTLIPLKKGRLLIPSLSVKNNGNVFKTNEIPIIVSDTPQQDNGQAEGGKDIFVEAKVSDTHPYVGQQIIYILKLYNAVEGKWALNHEPDFDGFTAKVVGDDKFYTTIISGRRYNVGERKYLLIPLKPGEISIESALLDCNIVRREKRRNSSPFDSFFDDSFFGNVRTERRTFQTGPVSVNVMPLPPYTGKIPYSGLVGNFTISAALKDKTMNVGDSTTLTITIDGNGNVMDAEAPAAVIPDAFKVYPDVPREDIHYNGEGVSGKKVFDLALVAVKEGEQTIPPLQLTCFDPEHKTYTTVSTPSFSITVNPSKEKENLNVFGSVSENPQTSVARKKVEFTGKDILPIKENLDAIKDHGVIPFYLFVVFMMIPALCYSVFKTVIKLTKTHDDPASVMAKRSENALKQAARIGESDRSFLPCLYKALVSAIFYKAGGKGESLTYVEAEKMLRDNGVSEEQAVQASELLKKIESAQYSGKDMDKGFYKELLAETKHIIRSLK